MRRYIRTFQVDAPLERVWHEIGERFGDVHRWAPGLKDAYLASRGGPGAGTRRVCIPTDPLVGMAEIREEITLWRPPRRLAYRLIEPPFPLSTMAADWSLVPAGPGTRVTVEVTVGLRGGRWLDPLVGLLWRWQLAPVVDQGIQGLCRVAEGRPTTGEMAVVG